MPPRGRQGGSRGARPGRGSGGAAASAAAQPAPAHEVHGVAALGAAAPLLTAIAAQQLGMPTSLPPLSSAQLDSVMRLLSAYSSPQADTDHLRYIMLHKPLLSALLQLAAAATETSAEEVWRLLSRKATSRAAQAEWSQKEVVLMGVNLLGNIAHEVVLHPAALWGPALDMSCQLLRMQILHRAARQAADGAAALRRGVQLPAAPCPDASWVWSCVVSLAVAVILPATFSARALAGCGPSALARCVEHRGRVAEALTSSGVLEHAAQGLVMLAARLVDHPGAAQSVQKAVTWLGYVANRAVCARSQASAGPDKDSAEVMLRAVLTPHLRHLLVGVGLAALQAADGGPAHGLDVRLYGSMVLMDPRASPPRAFVDTWNVLIDGLSTAGAADPHMRPARVAGLLLRTGRAALRCMDFGPGGRARGSWLGRADAAEVGRFCLVTLADVLLQADPAVWLGWQRLAQEQGQTAAGALPNPAVQPQQQPQQPQQRQQQLQQPEVDAWGLALAYLDALSLMVDGREVQVLATHLLARFCRLMGPHGNPGYSLLDHLPHLQAAVDGGLLTWMERTLRAAARSGSGSPLHAILDWTPACPPLAPMLLLGEPRHAASLLATLRKVVCASVAALAPGTLHVPRACFIARDVLVSLEQMPPSFLRGGAAAGAVGAAGASPAPAGGAPASGAGAAPPAGAAAPATPAAASAPAAAAASCPFPLTSLLLHELLPALAAWLKRTEPLTMQLLQAGEADTCQGMTVLWDVAMVWAQYACLYFRGARQAAARVVPAAEGGETSIQLTLGPSGTAGGAGGGGGSGQRDSGGSEPNDSAAAGTGGSSGGVRVSGTSAGSVGSEAGPSSSAAVDGGGGGAGRSTAAVDELLDRMGLVHLVGAALRIMRAVLRAEHMRGCSLVHPSINVGNWVTVALLAASVRPEEVRTVVRDAAGARGGPGAAAASSSGASPALQHWPIAELLTLAPPGAPYASMLSVLARQLQVWASGSDGKTLPGLRLHGEMPPLRTVGLEHLTSPAAARSLLRTCSNPGCTELKGDSEAGLEAGLLRCGGCGAAWYCCKGCQAAHWRAGHKGACGGKAGAAAGGSGGSGQPP